MTTNVNTDTRRKSKPFNSFMDEAVKLVKSMRGRGGLYGMLSITDRGYITEVGIYNYGTKQYALYKSSEIDEKAVVDIKKIINV